MIEKRVRPTLMSPLWKLGGFSLGAFTAILGKDYVMACTEAVETIIVDHYKSQIGQIEEIEIQKKIEKFLNDEAGHQLTGMNQIKNNDFKLKVFKKFIKIITKIAIKVSQKI
jgi:ubiquinone biosynthesis monooxygenase Coq7